MRTVIVGVLAFIVLVTLFWAIGGFISTVWNPMAWKGYANGCYEEIEKPRQKQQR